MLACPTLVKRCAFALLFFFAFSKVQAQYAPAWSSLDKRPIPAWWTDAKFGIFIHWGLYSVPAYAPANEVEGVYEKYAEHYMSRLQQHNPFFETHHNKYFGKDFLYADFVQGFKAEYFDPRAWADLFARAGARYVVLTSKHHDGFCLWPSAQSPKWNSVAMGPHIDVADSLTRAVRAAGLRMGFYYSLLEWGNPLYTPATMAQWTNQHMIPQMQDLVTRYKPDIIFADGEWDYDSKTLQSEKFLAWLYNTSPVKNTVVVNDRWGKETRSKHGDYFTTEYDLVHNTQGIGAAATHPWEESRGIGTSYGYNQFETAENYASSAQLIHLLISKVSNGGNLLLNVGPQANGLIPVVMQERLLDMGKWLRVNGEAIYGTTAWRTAQPGTNVFFTRKGQDIYVLCTRWPSDTLIVKGLSGVGSVALLGKAGSLPFTVANGSARIPVPNIGISDLPCDHAWVFKLENCTF